MDPVVLGIDTSNYRTSVCAVDAAGRIVGEVRELLPVPEGQRGLRQAEAVFAHVRQLGALAERLPAGVGRSVVAVAASTAPRPQEGSYMPVFEVGAALGRLLARLWKVPFYATTHQEMHVAAALATADRRIDADRFLAVHVSGGTSDMLLCTRRPRGFAIERIGGSTDLYAGQLIDRVGVALGLPFPAGPHLEALAMEAAEPYVVPSAVKGLSFSFSGPETALLRAIRDKAASPAAIARGAEHCIAKTLEKVLRQAIAMGYPKAVLLVGGVAANRYIRAHLKKRLEHPAVGATLAFAPPSYSGDNAYGVALLGWMAYKDEYLTQN
ncbi:O-sialoglycoprotein endopeptidase [Calditerricola yamamurae]|nr:O-sialoglycoprotein endopeptidase [Bacillota bacterium]